MQKKATSFLINTVADSQLELISEKVTLRLVILKLDSSYAVHRTSRKVNVKCKLFEVKLTVNEKPEDFFSNFEKALNELKSTDESITEEEKLSHLLLLYHPACVI